MTRNRLHSLAHRHNLSIPEGGAFADKNQDWWQGLFLSPVEKLRLQQDLALLEFLEPEVKAIDAELARLSCCDPWKEAVPYLIQLPGFGLIVVMTILSAVGDIQRFPTSKQLVGYSGLGASLHQSGQANYSGSITKQGARNYATFWLKQPGLQLLQAPIGERNTTSSPTACQPTKPLSQLLATCWWLPGMCSPNVPPIAEPTRIWSLPN